MNPDKQLPDPERDPVREQQQRDAGRSRGVRDEGEPEPRHVGEGLAHPDDERREEREPTALADDAGWDGRGDPPAVANSNRVGEREPHDKARTESRGDARPDPGGRGLWPPGPDDLRAWGTVQADSQPSLCRVADGLPPWMGNRRHALKALGNAVVPAVAEVVGRRVVEIMASTSSSG